MVLIPVHIKKLSLQRFILGAFRVITTEVEIGLVFKTILMMHWSLSLEYPTMMVSIAKKIVGAIIKIQL